MNAEQTDVIDALIEHENSIERLYKTFSSKVLNQKGFWWVLCQEEAYHARTLKMLKRRILDGAIKITKDRFAPKTLVNSMTYLKNLLRDVQTKDWAMVDALAIAFDIEKTLVECNVFSVYESDDPEVKKLLDELQRGTRTHLNKVRSTWDHYNVK